MKTVTYIGSHFGLSADKLPKLKNILVSLIEKGYNVFYCGDYGNFDGQVNSTLLHLKKEYTNIQMIKVKPYYSSNKFTSPQAKALYQKEKQEILDYYDGEELEQKLKYFENDLAEDFYNSKYLHEKYFFDEVVVCDLDQYPPKARIIECNKWKVRNSDVLVAYCPHQYTNSGKIRTYAQKLNKTIIDVN